MARKPRTQADRIRALVDRGKTYEDVMRRLGVSNAAVWQADHHRRPVGRPPQGLPKERLTVYIQGYTAGRLREAAGYDPDDLDLKGPHAKPIGVVIDELSAHLRQPTPPDEWPPCRECRNPIPRFDPSTLPAHLERLLSEITTQTGKDLSAHAMRTASIATLTLADTLDRLGGYCHECGPWKAATRNPPRA